jgi:hypothetical protein
MGADGRSRIKKKVRHGRKTGHRRAFRVQGRCWWVACKATRRMYPSVFARSQGLSEVTRYA